MTVFSKNLGGMAPLAFPGYACALAPLGNFLRTPLFTIAHQTSNRYIQLVMNNLYFIILNYLAAKKSGFLD